MPANHPMQSNTRTINTGDRRHAPASVETRQFSHRSHVPTGTDLASGPVSSRESARMHDPLPREETALYAPERYANRSASAPCGPFPAPRPFPTQARRTQLRHRGIVIVGLLALAIAAAVASCAFFTNLQNETYEKGNAEGGMATANLGDGQSSTPRDEWKQGVVPLLLQTDPAWADEAFAGSDIKTAGCGPTCMSMVYVALTGGTDKDPAAMARLCEEGGYVDSGMTSWLFMTDGAREARLEAEELPADASAVAAALDEGRPIIASMRPGDFTTEGHFIVLCGQDESGNLMVRDPNSTERSKQTWSMETVLSQCANLWAYGAA